MSVICVIWGREGTGKTSMALTFPRPLVHFDLDVGGYERAVWRLNADGLRSKSYLIPVQAEKLTGAQKQGPKVRFPKRVVGYREVWQELVTDFVEACQDKDVATLVIDSATQLWTICHTSMLQEKQEIQLSNGIKPEDPQFRERLQPVEFPNERMRTLIYTARSYKKNLVLTHYPRNVYKERFDSKGNLVSYKSDDIELDGFKDTVKLVDIVFWTDVDPKTNEPSAKVVLKSALPGLGMTSVGLFLPEPSYNGIEALRKALTGEE